jgi:hypothetical protein
MQLGTKESTVEPDVAELEVMKHAHDVPREAPMTGRLNGQKTGDQPCCRSREDHTEAKKV